MKTETKNREDLTKKLDEFLEPTTAEQIECTDYECIVKNDKSLVERINKKIITDDGRQLLM